MAFKLLMLERTLVLGVTRFLKSGLLLVWLWRVIYYYNSHGFTVSFVWYSVRNTPGDILKCRFCSHRESIFVEIYQRRWTFVRFEKLTKVCHWYLKNKHFYLGWETKIPDTGKFSKYGALFSTPWSPVLATRLQRSGDSRFIHWFCHTPSSSLAVVCSASDSFMWMILIIELWNT